MKAGIKCTGVSDHWILILAHGKLQWIDFKPKTHDHD